jgi:hypothetical protein
MRESYVIEVDDLSAGIVVREHAGYRFFAAAAQFFHLDGQIFGTVWRAEQAARELLRSKRAPRPAMQRSNSRRRDHRRHDAGWGLVDALALPARTSPGLAMPR